MTAFNKRLAPVRILGLPLGATMASLVTATGILSSVVLPGLASIVALAVALAALPIGIVFLFLGDDIVFARTYWISSLHGNLIAQEASWL